MRPFLFSLSFLWSILFMSSGKRVTESFVNHENPVSETTCAIYISNFSLTSLLYLSVSSYVCQCYFMYERFVSHLSIGPLWIEVLRFCSTLQKVRLSPVLSSSPVNSITVVVPPLSRVLQTCNRPVCTSFGLCVIPSSVFTRIPSSGSGLVLP